jgi:aminopeptidase N
MWIVLPKAINRGDKFTVKLQLEGHDTLWDWERAFHYPRSTETWFPRHGYLTRTQFDLTFHHRLRTKVISVGERVREDVSEDGGKSLVTEWRTPVPVAFLGFAEGQFERHNGEVKVAGHPVAIEYYSVPSAFAAVKEDFMVAELGNFVTFYSELFGDYPYPRLGAAFFPGNFGQGFATMLLLPSSGSASAYNFQFMSHEGAHQWWGNKVGWRSYRDQWLSEGFAEYSSLLYTARRENPKRAMEMMKTWRSELGYPPRTDTGVGQGRLADVGPLIMGYRLSSRQTYGAYTTLIYTKGGLVLRMLHFLFSNPSTGDDAAFYAMMRDFVSRHEGHWATTESFMQVAGEHFANTPIARKYGLKDLNWFLQQWIYQTTIPKYRLDYHFETGATGVELVGTLYQEGVPTGWFMPLPLKLDFPNNQAARGTVGALGPVTQLRIPLPAQPTKVELDPENWVLAWGVTLQKTK